MIIQLVGHSDDIISTDIDGKSDEIGAYNADDHIHAKTLRVATIGGSQAVDVHVVYDGTWSFAVSLIEEGRSLPPWTFAVDKGHEYSTRLTINTGADLVTLSVEGR